MKTRRATYHSSEKTRDQLNKANKCALALRTELHRLNKNNRALSALVAATYPNNALAVLVNKPDARRRLEAASRDISALTWWFRSAHNQVGWSKRGPHSEDAYWLVKSLDRILENFTGERISRSYKSESADYVRTVVKIADPKIGEGTIDAAMKACIYARGRERN